MVQGADIELFRPDEELKELAKLGLKLGLADILTSGKNPAEILSAIGAAANGAEWLKQWEEAHDPWFNFTVGNGFYSSDKYWNEHPELPLSYIHSYVERLQRGETIDRPMDELVAERTRIIEEYSSLLDDAQRAEFEGKLGLAMTVYPYVENHNFYIEHWTMGAFWRKMRQLSRILHEAGFWPEPNDMFYLRRDEVREVLFDYATGWAVAAKPVGPAVWPARIEKRRQIVDALDKKRPEPALNEPPATITEPFTIMLWGITSERVESWLGGDDESGDLTGMAASPGVVEGIARVINSPDELDQIVDGEILVAPVTAPSWGPVFGKIKATVTDIGGMMSHAAIVCREYNLPAVTGTGSASTRITTGMKIRVDGTQGRVTILD
jgi:pyruvate,water dikinase